MSSSNLWKAFQGIVPKAPQLIGQITAINSGTVTVTLTNGGTYVARGTGTIGDTVVIEGNFITSTLSGGLTSFGPQDV